jgi:7,8-dihydropterin-6-yl-methyl-4-(beta-D-ribofuranosyl)aminobenzene 5'-phosphate synthase
MCSDHGTPSLTSATVPDVGEVRNAGEVIALEPVDSVAVTTICDNTIDVLLVDQGPAHRLLGRSGERPRVAASTLESGQVMDFPLAQHGFSLHMAVTKGDAVHRMLFDTGITPNGCRENLARLDLAVGDLEAIVLSHGHFDHTTGLSGLIRTLGRGEFPVVLHPEFFTDRRIAFPGREPFELPTTSRRALSDGGFQIIESRRPSFLFDGSVLVTGEVDRTSSFETGFPNHQAYRGDSWEADPLILDDQAVVVHVNGKGLVILTGCGHAGIVNICRYARHLTGIDAIYAVIGGFHLNGPSFEPMIGATCDAMAELAPEVIVPAHCTGWKATQALSARFPANVIQNSVGTTFDLVSSPAP